MSDASRRILVSGGTSGIGHACVERLASGGHQVWVLGSREAGLRAVRDAVPLAGSSRCDVADADAVEGAIAEAVAKLGGLDGAFVNAGIDGLGAPATDVDVAHFRRVLDVNVIGAFLVAREAAKAMKGPASIVMNASVNALRPESGFVDYNASKAAVVAIARTMAVELAPAGIAVTALCPGYFPTPMTAPYLDDPSTRTELLAKIPAGRFGRLDELAALVDFLLTSNAAYMTGGVITMDGAASA
ncbi:SDR family NAD(P)-dependent oxidoreductase [Streptomyces sp. NPDC058398]|uniref:SDR family NAD(P)-dependent oxidoreductase n=1 Tax=Streptomyces sp. NPDC058398 TaxID=3346479 RepID=UPI0036613D6F